MEDLSLSALIVIYVPGSGVYKKSAVSVGDESAEAAFWKVTSGAGLKTRLLSLPMDSEGCSDIH